MSLFSEYSKTNENSDKEQDFEDFVEKESSKSSFIDEEEKKRSEYTNTVNKFFDERITESKVEKIIKRVSRPEIKETPKYESFDSCVEVLK